MVRVTRLAFLVLTSIQVFLIVIVKSQTEEINLSPDIWKENEELLEMENRPMPNFLSQGMRISEAKCHEYIWEVKQEENRIAKVIKYSTTGLVSVTGGRDAKPNEFPHMGALGWRTRKGSWSFKCGSFLISDQFLLTAAHCQVAPKDSELEDFKPKIVRLGVDNIIKGDVGKNPLDIKIMKFIKHPEYKGILRRHNDIALIMLRQKVQFSKFVRPACILNLVTDKAIVTGWGVIDKGRSSKRTSEHLKAAEVDIVDTDTCNIQLHAKRTKKWPGVLDYQFCATDLGGIGDICNGDSGGPIQIKMTTKTQKPIYNVIGITSFGYICGNHNFPSVYTNVSGFIDWIENEVWNSEKPSLQPTTMKPQTTTSKPLTTTSKPRTTTNQYPTANFYPTFKPFTPNEIPHIPSIPRIPRIPRIPHYFNIRPNYPPFYKPYHFNGYFEDQDPSIFTNHPEGIYEHIDFDDK